MDACIWDVVWFRKDLRLADHLPLLRALEKGKNIVFLYLLDENDPWFPAGAQKTFLFHALNSLEKEIEQRGSSLILKKGTLQDTFSELFKKKEVRIHFYADFENYGLIQEEQLKILAKKNGWEIKKYLGRYLTDFDGVKTKQGAPFQVFTLFWKSAFEQVLPLELSLDRFKFIENPIKTKNKLKEWSLLPEISWDKNFYQPHFFPSEKCAQIVLKQFLLENLEGYLSKRDYPSLNATSHLSSFLHFGLISIQRVFYEIKRLIEEKKVDSTLAEGFIRQLFWRDFAAYVLYHFPDMDKKSVKRNFDDFLWKKDKNLFLKWKKGQTGYPLIDAAMRALWQTGLMHNRLRMVVASFLVKDLHIPWQWGAEWFWETLLDADLANNSFGWQWTAGCGFDAAPYFRVFNPEIQSKKFDPEGIFIKKYLPELHLIPSHMLHNPLLFKNEFEKRGVFLGKEYPFPIIDHAKAKEEALNLWKKNDYF